MPGVTLPAAPRYSPGPPTSEDLEYADLAIVDISKASTPEGRAELAITVRKAMTNVGFFYVVNHGYDQAQVGFYFSRVKIWLMRGLNQIARITDISDVFFSGVSQEDKKLYEGTMKTTGSYQGYKLRNYWHVDAGVRDQIEHYNFNKDVYKREHPQPIRPFLPEIEAFARHNHFNVVHPVLRLLALGLELDEETLVNIHGFNAPGDAYVRFMKYYPRSEEDETRTKNVWLKGHTDSGSITILWSQPVSGLQILTPNGKWKWIKHIDNALVINAGDALEFLSGGYYRATIHRVVQPPSDQRSRPRLGAFYFCLTDDTVKLLPFVDSPVLQRVGIKRRFSDEQAPSMEAWRKGRTSAYGQTELKKAIDGVVEEEVINGVLVQHYN